MRFRICSDAGTFSARKHVSTFDRKFSWVTIAPFGNPVVPLVYIRAARVLCFAAPHTYGSPSGSGMSGCSITSAPASVTT